MEEHVSQKNRFTAPEVTTYDRAELAVDIAYTGEQSHANPS